MMVSPSGGTGSYTYSWAPISNSINVLNGSPAGLYTCTITDQNGCIATATFNLTQPPALSVSTMQTNLTCNGGNNGSAMVMASGGTPGYTYFWLPTGGNASTASALTAGTYTCIVTDLNGCSSSPTVNITAPPAITASTMQTNVSCNGGNNGDAMVMVSGGVTPYTYAWSSGGTGAMETGLGAGTYTCTITDANSCTSVQTATITEPAPFNPSAIETNVTCFGGNDGAIDITVTGGTLPYTYDWNNNTYTTEDISGLSAGTYIIVVTDANGCTVSGTLAVVQPSQIAHNGVVTNASGCTTNDGMIDLTTLGGTGPFTFVWSNSSTSEDQSGLDGGVYSVVITDSLGCTESATFTITEPGAPTVTYSEPTDTACGGSLPTPAFTLSGESPAGGTWSGPGVSGNIFDPMTANIGYNVITYNYTDSAGCSGSAMDSIWVDLCMGLASQVSGLNSQFSIFPNPTTGLLNIITNGDNATIVVTDALGRQVTSVVSNSTSTQIDLSGNANGMYFVRVEQNGNTSTQRVMIAK